jgi:hypothetical protein
MKKVLFVCVDRSIKLLDLASHSIMFPNAAPTGSARTTLPPAVPVANWSVALYRKAEPILPLNPSDISQTPAPQQTYGSFYVQLQQQATSSSPSRSDVLYFRYQAQLQKNSADSHVLPFTICQLSDMKLSPELVPISTTSVRATNNEQNSGRIFEKKLYRDKSNLKERLYLHTILLDF